MLHIASHAIYLNWGKGSKCLAISSKKQIHGPNEFKAKSERSCMLPVISESWKFSQNELCNEQRNWVIELKLFCDYTPWLGKLKPSSLNIS